MTGQTGTVDTACQEGLHALCDTRGCACHCHRDGWGREPLKTGTETGAQVTAVRLTWASAAGVVYHTEQRHPMDVPPPDSLCWVPPPATGPEARLVNANGFTLTVDYGDGRAFIYEAPEDPGAVIEYVVVLRTRSTGRRMYVSRINGQPTTSKIEKAKRWSDRAEAARSAELWQQILDRGRGGVNVFVETAP